MPSPLAMAISCATAATTSGSSPIAPPPNTSPESLRSTRRWLSDMFVLSTGVRLWPRSAGAGATGWLSGADAEADEAGDRPARGGDTWPTLCFGSRANAWSSSTFSLKKPFIRPSTIFGSAAAGLPSLRAVSSAIFRSAATVSAGTSSRESTAGSRPRCASRRRGDVGPGRVGRDEHAPPAGEVLRRAVHVGLDVLAGDARDAAHLQALADGGSGVGQVEAGGLELLGGARTEEAATSTAWSPSAMNFAFFATKSVSQLISTSVPTRAPSRRARRPRRDPRRPPGPRAWRCP